jgi:amino-acid N-acetyltransferase
MAVTLRRVDDEGLEAVARLLDAEDLPTADLRDGPGAFFAAHADGDRDSGERVGVGGLEIHGSHGLLRSVVVREPHRGEGYGAAICEGLEREARERGVGTLWLLTTTAAGFFAARGYERVAREAAPAAIRDTAEFAELCPDSATAMLRRL